MTGSPEPRAFGASAEGEHPGGRPGNQDAFGTHANATRATIAVADGHGSTTCFRSELGSRFAVETVLDLGAREFERLGDLEREGAQVRFRRLLVDTWRERVLAHVAANPFRDEEFAASAAPGRERELRAAIEAEPTLAYGSTLLFVAADDEHIVYMQIGDGETIAVDAAGGARTIFPKPANLLANETFSLCQEDAWQFVRLAVHHRGAEEPAFVVAATDGFGNAFPSPTAARRRAVALGSLIERSEDDARGHLAALAEASSAASMDDATLAMLVPPPRAPAAASPPPAPQAPAGFRLEPPAPARAKGAGLGIVIGVLAGLVLGAAIGWFGYAYGHPPLSAPTPIPSAVESARAAIPAPLPPGEATPFPASGAPASAVPASSVPAAGLPASSVPSSAAASGAAPLPGRVESPSAVPAASAPSGARR